MILLSVLVPITLLAAFRLTRVLPEPPTPETITVEAVSWNMSRPSFRTNVNEEMSNSYSDNMTAISLVVHIWQYEENHPSRGDNIEFAVTASANLSLGFIHSMVVRFSRTDDHAVLHVDPTPNFIELENLKLERIREPATNRNEACFETKTQNQPQYASLGILIWWLFLDDNTTNHIVTITLETTISNETTYRKVVIPIELGVKTPREAH